MEFIDVVPKLNEILQVEFIDVVPKLNEILQVEFIDVVPKLPSGKIQRKILRAAEQAKREAKQ